MDYAQNRIEMDGTVYNPGDPITVTGAERERLLARGAIGPAPPGAPKVEVNVGVEESAAEAPPEAAPAKKKKKGSKKPSK